MGKRMDKYEQSSNDVIPKRSEKNKELYKQIYNAYDEFENLVVPSNAKEININDLKKEISSRDEYRQIKDVESITNTNPRIKRIDDEDEIVDKTEETKQEDTVYDINQLLDKAVSSSKKEDTIEPTLSSGDYLKKLKLDRTKTNLEQVKEMYNSMEDDMDNNEELLKTASLSLEILSDLKGTDDNTAVSAIEEDDIDEIIAKVDSKVEEDTSEEDDKTEEEDYDFYSTNYKFSKKDFEGKKEDNIDKKLLKKKKVEEEEDEDYEEEDEEGGHSFLKIFLLIFGILLVVAIVVYLIIYFGKN